MWVVSMRCMRKARVPNGILEGIGCAGGSRVGHFPQWFRLSPEIHLQPWSIMYNPDFILSISSSPSFCNVVVIP